MKTKDDGFTLIEILVVICIIAILSSIAILNYQKIKTKAQAAQLASHLHAIEDGIITAIIDGRTKSDFFPGSHSIKSSTFNNSILKSYLTLANFTEVPTGISFSVSSRAKPKSSGFIVYVTITGVQGTEKILDELEKMFPKTLSHRGKYEWVSVDSETLKVKPK
jgi:prepilin-type N-terminal cleavage/methylation domain-containing protein